MSFKQTYKTYFPELICYGRQLQVAEADLDDLVQETFLRYHVEVSKKILIRNKRAWLYKVFHNLVVSKNVRKSLYTNKIKEYQMAYNGDEPNLELEERERRNLVFSMLEKLPEENKNLLLLYHNGLKYKEIAKVLNLNPNSVGTMLVRSIDKLKQLLKTEYYELFG
jgi:RNA polymerase sigma-70 factor (ECF subfamily)